MEKFLSESRQKLADIENCENVCVVMGNEACDLDSVTCALLYARYLNSKGMHSAIHLPILNIPRDDYLLKTEVSYLLERLNISSDILIFRDEVPLNKLLLSGALKLVLVDHNILSLEDASLDKAVVEIIDHHKKEHEPSDKIQKMMIEPVGSCSTLVASSILKDAPELLDQDAVTLLLGAILLDVANFSVSAKRATAEDEKVFKELIKLFPDLSTNSLYNDLQHAKQDVSRLSLEQLLRKDAKVIEVDGISVAVCGFPFLCANLRFSDLELIEKLSEFSAKHKHQAIVLMGIEIDAQTDTVKRDIGAYSHNAWLRHRISQGLEKEDSGLKLSVEKCLADFILYNQGNILATRKYVLPLLKDMLAKLELPGCYPFQLKSEGRPSCNTESSPEGPSPSGSSGIETPTNSCDEDTYCEASAKGTFHSAEDVVARLHSRRIVGSAREGSFSLPEGSDPFTPENSYVEGHFDQSYKKFVLNQVDPDTISKKLRQENFFHEEEN